MMIAGLAPCMSNLEKRFVEIVEVKKGEKGGDGGGGGLSRESQDVCICHLHTRVTLKSCSCSTLSHRQSRGGGW